MQVKLSHFWACEMKISQNTYSILTDVFVLLCLISHHDLAKEFWIRFYLANGIIW